MATWKVGAKRDLPIDEDASWDGSAAKASIFAWAGFDGDSPDPAKARQGFLVYDADDTKLKGSYKLPFAKVIDGKLTALASGLRAASSRLPQTDDLPDSVQTDARAVLDAYFEKIHGDSGSGDNSDGGRASPSASYVDAGVTFSRVLHVDTRATTPTPDLMALAEKRGIDTSIFEEYPPFFWSAQASNSQWDAYDTRMAASTLKNYADDATAGVAFLRNHDTGQDPIGGSLQGRFVGAGGNGVARTEIDFYALTDPDTLPYIAKMRAGIVRDVSVGFYGGAWMCSICGRDMMQWMGPDSCPHLLGVMYTPRDEAGDKRGDPVLARASIEGAHLAEVSGVYDGATPGAMISKARMLAQDGQLSPRKRELVQARYRIALPDARRGWAGAESHVEADGHTVPPQKEVSAMPPETEDNPTATRETPTQPQAQAQTQETPPTQEQDSQRATPPTAQDAQNTAPTDGATPGTPGTPATEERQTPAGAPDDAGVVLAGLSAEASAVVLSALRSAGVDVVGSQTPTDALRALVDEVKRLRPLADDGRAYRSDLISEAMAEGVRAHGETFAQETYRGLLENPSMPIDAIKRMRDDWKATGDKLFAPGRQTQDQATPQPHDRAFTPRANELPAAAFRG